MNTPVHETLVSVPVRPHAPIPDPGEQVPGGREAFINAMARAANSVSVVTTGGQSGRFGITVTSVSSVSADPPLVLACINRRSPVCNAIQRNQVFCVNLLSYRQRDIADVFAGRPVQGAPFDFDRVPMTDGVTGAACFRDAVAVFDCHLYGSHNAGSHTIFLGQVAMTLENGGSPLLYSNRSYGCPTSWSGHDHAPFRYRNCT